MLQKVIGLRRLGFYQALLLLHLSVEQLPPVFSLLLQLFRFFNSYPSSISICIAICFAIRRKDEKLYIFMRLLILKQVAALVSTVSAIYMRVFLKETVHQGSGDGLTQPILKKAPGVVQSDDDSPQKVQVFKKVPSLKDISCLLKSR